MPRHKNQGKGESEISPRRVVAKERGLQAVRLRAAGLTLEQICKQLDFKSPSTARSAIKTAIKNAQYEAVEDLRAIEGESLNIAQLAIWKKVQAGDDRAIQTFIRISERRAKLFGLDKESSTPVQANGQFVIQYISEAGRVLDKPAWVIHNEPDQITSSPPAPSGDPNLTSEV
jgi:hypothetical protein